MVTCKYANIATFYRENERQKSYVAKSAAPYVHNKKDTYLTLEVLAAILESLSESGKNLFGFSFLNVKKFHFYYYDINFNSLFRFVDAFLSLFNFF